MKQWMKLVGLASLFVLLLAACGGSAPAETADEPLEAVPLEIEAESATAEPAVETAVSEPTAGPMEEVEPTEQPAEEPMPTEAPMEEPAATETPMEEPTAVPQEEPAGATGDLTIFAIDQTQSEVRFELDEDLAGSRMTVVGVTNQVAGELGINYADLSTAQVGVIRIDASSFVTDNNFRNRAIQNRILNSGTYQFIDFVPQEVVGLPASVTVGEEIAFSIVGELTVRDVTQPVTFDVVATAVSETQISGTASTIITQEMFGISIPSVPNVANVEEEIELYIDFVANSS